MSREQRKEPWFSLVGKFVGAVLGVISLAGMAVSVILFLSGLFQLPEALEKQAVEIQNIRNDVNTLTATLNNAKPTVLNIAGTAIPAKDEVRQGESLIFVYTLRRNITCDTLIDIRFWSHERNVIENAYSYQRYTKKAPVTSSMIHYPVTIEIPKELPPGIYSYAPLIKPVDCGVYGEQELPLSLKFKVLGAENGN